MKTLTILLATLACSIHLFGQSPYIHHSYEKNATPDMEAPIDFIDLDNDGDEDLMNVPAGSFARFYRSNGTSIDSLDYVEVSFTQNIIPADWDNNGLPDLLNNYGSVKLIQNTGNFTFSPAVEISPSGMYNLDTAHIDSDAYIDAFAISSNTIDLYINQSGAPATTNYSITTNYNMNTYNTEIGFNDIENDGLNEMFVKAINDKIYIYTQTGSMDYVLQDSIVSTSIGNVENGSMYFFDLNNDGNKELITRDGWFIRVFEWTSGYNYNLVYSGDATYSVNTGFGFAGLEQISDFYDVDQNGYLDIVAGNSVFFNNANFSFNEVAINTTPRLYESHYKCGDIDNNGKTDICYVYTVANTHYGEAFYRSENNVGQTIDSKELIWYLWGYTHYDGDVLDYDNDGDADVVSYNTGKVILWENINDTLHPKYAGSALPYYTEYVDVVDINQDNYLDLIWSTVGLTTDDHGYRFNNGIDMNSGAYLTSSNMHLKLIADIDNDGIEELFYHRKSGSTNNYLYLYRLNTGVPVLAGTVLYWSDFNVDDVVVRLADYDLDGLTDVIIQHENSGSNKIRLVHNDGSDVYTAGQVVSISGGEELLGVFDSNGDQYPDLHWHDGNTRIWRNLNASGTMQGSVIIYTGPSNTFSGTNGFGTDFNGDYLTDLVVQGPTQLRIFKNDGLGLQLYYSETFPATANNNHITRLMDVDNDGDEDLVSYDNWYENLSGSPYETVGSVYYDINTNGSFDPGTDVMFPSFPVQLNNNWYNSYTDSSGFFSIPLGSAGSYNFSIGDAYTALFNPTTAPYPAVSNVSSGTPVDSVSIGVTNVNNVVDGTLDATLSGHRCNEAGRLFLQVQNFSPVDADLELKVKIAANSSVIGSNVTFTQNSDTLIWQVNNMSPFEMNQLYVDLNMPATAFMGDTMHFHSFATFNTALGALTVGDTIDQILTCAYDPNDKNITMTEHVYLGDSIYSFVDETEYLIRFQNTGNDTAQTIVIRDYLTNLFDWSTIRPVSASHPYQFAIDSIGHIQVTFNDINLPDSSVNFLGSMGYIKFKVDYADNSPRFVPVNNYAMIFFDANPPIFTNSHQFFRVDCIDFINIDNLYTSACLADSVTVMNNDYGLPFNYTWTMGAYTDNTEDLSLIPVSGTGMQNYNLQISNFGCVADSAIDIEIYPNPDLTLTTGDTSVCYGSSLNIGAGQSVDWYLDGQFQTTANNLWLNYYDTSVVQGIATNTYGCMDSTTITISTIPQPVSMHDYDNSTMSNTVVYLCDDVGQLTVTSNYDSLVWDVNYYQEIYPDYTVTDTAITIPMDIAETSLWLNTTINYQGCQFYSSTYFVLGGFTNVTLIGNGGDLSIQNQGTSYFCDEDSIIVDANRHFDWFYEGNYLTSGITLNATQSGMYTAEDSCGATTWFEIVNGTSSTSTDVQVACDSYTWIDGNTYTSSTNAPVMYLNNSTGCDSTVTLDLTINPSSSGTDVQTSCSAFTWIDGNTYTSSTNTPTWTLPNMYGCDSLVTLNLTVNMDEVTDVQEACGSYTWIDGNTYTNSINNPTMLFTNSFGCDSLVTLNLTITPLPDNTVTQTDVVLSSDQIAAQYQWLDCDDNYSIITNATSQSYTSGTTGNYAVEVTVNGCTDTSACYFVDYSDMDELFAAEISVYPNPTSAVLYINNPAKQLFSGELTDLSGRTIERFEVENDHHIVDLSRLSKGSYLIKLYVDQQYRVLKVEKM